MAYATLEGVKERLGITHGDDDVILGNKMTQADNWIDRQLSPYTATPLPSPPQEIIDAACDIAGGYWKEDRSGTLTGPRPIPHIMRARGQDDVLDYIRVNYLGPKKRAGYIRHVKSHSSHDRNHRAYEDATEH